MDKTTTKLKTRTITQNKALHKYFDLVAQECDNNGVTVQALAKAITKAEIQVTPTIVKEFWKQMQEIMLGKDSTTKLTRDEVDKVYQMFSMWLARDFGIDLPFPHVCERCHNIDCLCDYSVGNYHK